jgi:GNAT superfamily N-acetyltransferase
MAVAPIVTRPFRPTDSPGLAALHRRAILALPDALYGKAERQSWAHGLSSGTYLSAVADEQILQVAVDGAGEPVAFCAHRESEVLDLYVDPDWQRHGIGRHLLRRAEPMMAAHGCSVARIIANLAAAPFFQRCGYQTMGNTTQRTPGGLMVATLHLEKFIAL